MNELQVIQTAICKKFEATPHACPANLKVGISADVRQGLNPIYGVRILPTDSTCGWYIWSGEYSSDDDFFQSLHVEHLHSRCDLVLAYLQLPPGWRFVIAPDYEDVWFDPEVLS